MTAIAAIATPQSSGGIGIVRISGKNAREIASKVFVSVKGKSIMGAKGYTAMLGKIYSGEEFIDEAVCLVFAAPNSYTGEDVVELSCHGGTLVTSRVLQAVLDSGAVLASAGEFTKRAFLNGKIDLTQADAVMDIITAKSNHALKAALAAKDGAVSKRTADISGKLIALAGHLAAWADFPEEDIEEVEEKQLKKELELLLSKTEELIKSFDAGRFAREGVPTVIAGRPNVGKSTLMNLLSDSEKSIVTPVAGTTRDIVEETVRFGRFVLNLSDTAGIRDGGDEVEKIGIEKARSRIELSYLVLAVFDGSELLCEDDKALIELLPKDRTIALINKADKEISIDKSYIESKIKYVAEISAKERRLADLEDMVSKILGMSDFDANEPMLFTERQRQCAVNCKKGLCEALSALDCGMTLDAVSVSLDYAIEALLELTGQKVTDEVVDSVFHRFCVGK